MNYHRELILEQSLAHYGQDDFESVLFDELNQHSYHLPLDHFCRRGGMPDIEDELQFRLDSMIERGGKAVIDLTCFFKEVVPTSCGEISFPRDASAEFELVLDLGDATAETNYDDDR